MNKLRREANYLGGTILQAFYMFVSYQVNLSFKYDNGYEFFIGTIVTTILMNIVDFAIYKIAFDRAGACNRDSSEKKVAHWGIRFALIVVVYLISITPLCDIILTPIVKDCTELSIDMFNWFIADMNKSLTDVFLN